MLVLKRITKLRHFIYNKKLTTKNLTPHLPEILESPESPDRPEIPSCPQKKSKGVEQTPHTYT